jgi:uncharacterized SAM-binding protein YcdF (DUF218 family)
MKGRIGATASLAAVVLVVLFFWRGILEGYGGWLEVEDREERADVVVVLDGGKGERLWKALDLWNRGLCAHLVITGESEPILPVYAGGPGITQADAKRQIAIRKGVPEEAVEVLLGPTSTFEEAEAIKKWCASHDVDTVTVVTSPFHTRRARAVFRHVLKDAPVAVRIAHAPWEIAGSSPKRWWTREKDLVAIFDESAKTLYYLGHHHISPF